MATNAVLRTGLAKEHVSVPTLPYIVVTSSLLVPLYESLCTAGQQVTETYDEFINGLVAVELTIVLQVTRLADVLKYPQFSSTGAQLVLLYDDRIE
jgi:hypothetical protein